MRGRADGSPPWADFTRVRNSAATGGSVGRCKGSASISPDPPGVARGAVKARRQQGRGSEYLAPPAQVTGQGHGGVQPVVLSFAIFCLGPLFRAAQCIDFGSQPADRSGAVVNFHHLAGAADTPVVVAAPAVLLPGHPAGPRVLQYRAPRRLSPFSATARRLRACLAYAVSLKAATTAAGALRSTSSMGSDGAPASTSATWESACRANSAAVACRAGRLRSLSCRRSMILGSFPSVAAPPGSS